MNFTDLEYYSTPVAFRKHSKRAGTRVRKSDFDLAVRVSEGGIPFRSEPVVEFRVRLIASLDLELAMMFANDRRKDRPTRAGGS